MTTRGSRSVRGEVGWRHDFVEELGVLAPEMGIPRATARVLGWMVVCEPPEQTARDMQDALALSAGAVSSATRVLIAGALLERTAHSGDRCIYYRLRTGSWEGVLESRLRTLMRLREVAERGLEAAGGAADDRLQDLCDIYGSFEDQLDELLAKRRAGG